MNDKEKQVNGNSFDYNQYQREHPWETPESAKDFGKNFNELKAIGRSLKLDKNSQAFAYLTDFKLDEGQIKLLFGPVGSGKTLMSALKIWWYGRYFIPMSVDKKHYVKAGCFMRNKKECFDKAFQTFNQWFGTCGKLSGNIWNGAMSIDGRQVVLEIHFTGPDDQKWSDFLQSFELNIAWFPETTTSEPIALEQAIKRSRCNPKVPYSEAGFYEKIGDKLKKDIYGIAPAVPGFVIGDFNAGSPTSFLKPWCEIGAKGVTIYTQIGYNDAIKQGVKMENVENLPKGYYESQWTSQLRMRGGAALAEQKLNNKWVAGSEDAVPVFGDNFNQDFHTADVLNSFDYGLSPNIELPLLIGIDPGRQYGVLFAQKHFDGRLVVYKEITEDYGGNVFDMAEKIRSVMRQHFNRFKAVVFLDPAGRNKNFIDKRSVLEILTEELNLDVREVGDNDVMKRLSWVDQALAVIISGKAGLLIDKDCEKLIYAMGAGYRFLKRKSAGEVIVSEDIQDNSSTHIVDALQYLIGGIDLYDEFEFGGGVNEIPKNYHKPLGIGSFSNNLFSKPQNFNTTWKGIM